MIKKYINVLSVKENNRAKRDKSQKAVHLFNKDTCFFCF